MPTFSNLQIPPPSNWQDFENLCCDLWRAIWKDPNTQKNGRQGQSQNGVDIYGRPELREKWAGVQSKAARQSKWLPSQPYTIVLKILSGKTSEESSTLSVSTNFLYELWKQPILAEQRDYLILSLLDVVMAGRNRQAILNKLISNVKRRFLLLPPAEKQIMSLIEIWNQMHII